MKTIKCWLLVWIIPFVLCMSGPVQANVDEEELISTAQRAFNDGFHDVAIRYLEQFVPRYPDSPKINQAKLLLGQCYYFKNQYEKAIDLMKSVTPTQENQDMLLYWQGETYLKLGNYPQARANYEKLIEQLPDSVYIPQALYSLGWSFFDAKQYALARKALGTLVTRFPKHQLKEDAMLKMAESIYNLGKYDVAVDEFQQYLAAHPQSPHAAEVNLNIADALYYAENFTAAFNAYEKALKAAKNPRTYQIALVGKIWCGIKKKMYDQAQKWIKDALEFSRIKDLSTEDILLAQAHLFYQQGERRKSVDAFGDLVKKFPAGSRRLEAYLGRANASYLLKDFAQAAKDYKFIIDHHQPQSDNDILDKANLGLGWSYVKMDKLQDAIKHFRGVAENASSKRTRVNAMVQIGDAYHDSGKYSEAVGVYLAIQKDFWDSPYTDYVLYREGIVFLKMDNIAAAQTAFKSLQTSFPKSKYLEEINYYLGVIEFKKSNWTSAAKRMESFLKALTHPSDFAPEANYILALSYMNLKQPDEALKVFLKILRLYPNDAVVAKNSDIGIAKCQFELGQIKEAVKRFKMIVFKYPKTDVQEESLLWLAQYAMKSSLYEEAVEYYTQLIETFPDNPHMDQMHYELGQAYEVQNNMDQALVHYKAISAKNSTLVSKAKLAIAGIFSKEFDLQKALSAYQSIASTNPEYARDAYLKMAQLYRNSQDYDNEIETYKKALGMERGKASVSNAELLFNIADAYEATNRLDQAVDTYLKISVQYSDQTAWVVKAYLRVAQIFEGRQDWEGAKVTYQKIVQLKVDESKYAQERLDQLKKK